MLASHGTGRMLTTRLHARPKVSGLGLVVIVTEIAADHSGPAQPEKLKFSASLSQNVS